MLIMRLQRIGKKGQAYFRAVVTEHTKKPQGEFLELLGSYDPHKKVLKMKKDRVEYWRSKGVGISPTLNNILINQGVIDGDKKLSWKPKVKPAAPPPAGGSPAATAPNKEAAPTEEAPVENKEETSVEIKEETPAA